MNRQHQQLLLKLPSKQQTLDFGAPTVWQQLSAEQRRECHAALAELVYQVATAKVDNNEEPLNRNDEHE